MAYAADDAMETLGIGAILAPPYFVQAQLLPFDYQAAALRGDAAKIDALLHARVPRAVARRSRRPAPAGRWAAATPRCASEGVGGPVLHVDVTSLYPSLMLARAVARPPTSSGVFLALLDHLRDVPGARQAPGPGAPPTPEERRILNALQQTFKILINSFYGYLAFSQGHWNDFAAANRVTTEGRPRRHRHRGPVDELGATPIEADTDGVYFCRRPVTSPRTTRALLETIASRPARGHPARARRPLRGDAVSYKMKNYALLDERGALQLKGSGFRSRGLEPFQRRVIEEVVRLLLEGKRAEVRSVIDRWLTAFAAHQVPIRQFARTETLQDTVDVYRQRVEASLRSPSAAYELMIATGRTCQPGDQVSYYVAGRSRNVMVNEQARLASEWDSTRPDENVEHYQGKVLEIWDRFRRFTESEGLVPYRDESAEDEAQLSLF